MNCKEILNEKYNKIHDVCHETEEKLTKLIQKEFEGFKIVVFSQPEEFTTVVLENEKGILNFKLSRYKENRSNIEFIYKDGSRSYEEVTAIKNKMSKLFE